MKPRTNTSATVRNTHTSNSTFGIAIAGLVLALTPIASLADGPQVVITGGPVATIRPAHEEGPTQPRHIGPDYNHSGVVDIDDLFDYFTGWFAGKPAADTNLNGLLEIQDVLDFVNIWFESYGKKASDTDPRQ